MTVEALASLLDEYEAGLDAELQLLGELETMARRQRDISLARDYTTFNRESETRERLTHALLAIEERLRPVRDQLAASREAAVQLPAYDRVVERHGRSQRVIARILATDQESLRVMREAEAARKLALARIEQGEVTLAAYRRVLVPTVATPTLVNKRG